MNSKDHITPNTKETASLAESVVDVWRASLNQADNPLSDLSEILSKDERERAKRFHFEQDRIRFVNRHRAMRGIVASYLSVTPARVTFINNQFGKPELQAGHADGGVPLKFNLTYSRDLALIAVAFGTEVGVDLEYVDPQFSIFEVADRYFSQSEVTAIRKLPEDLQSQAFFTCWTLKEAYLKAIGMGLSHPLPKTCISTAADDPRSISVTADPTDTAGWCVASFIPAENYVAAIAYKCPLRGLTFLDWPIEKS